MAIGSGALSWCLRRFGSLFRPLVLAWRTRILAWKHLHSNTVLLSVARCDVVTKDPGTARAPWELFVRRGCRWKLIHDPKFESSRNRAKRGLDILAEADEDEFAADVPSEEWHLDYVKWMFSQFSQSHFLHTCSGLRFLCFRG